MTATEKPIDNADKLFDGSGKLTSEATCQLLKKFVDAFGQWIERTFQR
jgi:hypothetical protein